MKTKYYLFQQVKEQNNDITFNCIKTCNLAGLGQMFHIEKKKPDRSLKQKYQ